MDDEPPPSVVIRKPHRRHRSRRQFRTADELLRHLSGRVRRAAEDPLISSSPPTVAVLLQAALRIEAAAK